MNLRHLINQYHPELKEKYNSTQYELSQELIRLKLHYKLSQGEMASLSQIPLIQYLEMENGSTSFSVSTYKEIITTLHQKLIKKNK